ncbi:MAG: VWA domain-containing protein [Vicinamibacterales bacterium]
MRRIPAPAHALALTLGLLATASLSADQAATRQPPKPVPPRTTTDVQGPIISTSVEVVPLYATVFDRDVRLVPDLAQADFEILDNGVAQEVTIFRNEVLPINVVVMLDTSLSMTLNLDLVKAGAEQFFLRMLPGDKGIVGAFADRIHFPRDPADGLIADRDELVSLIKALDFGNGTKLYDAIEASLVALKGVQGRKVVLVLTDGDDTTSHMSLNDVLDRARKEDVMVYAIGIESVLTVGRQVQRTRPDRGLKKLAEETGGGYFELKKTDELGATFTRVAQELHSQYVLGFEPTAMDGKVHKLDLRVKKPGLTARARKSYLASPKTPAPTEPRGPGR